VLCIERKEKKWDGQNAHKRVVVENLDETVGKLKQRR
jgi:hypothetical protein